MNSSAPLLLGHVSVDYLILIILILSAFCSASIGIIWFFVKKTFESFQKAIEKFSGAIEKLGTELKNHRREVDEKLEEGSREFRNIDMRLVKQETTCQMHQEERREGLFDRRVTNFDNLPSDI
jgi:hypothetical protein